MEPKINSDFWFCKQSGKKRARREAKLRSKLRKNIPESLTDIFETLKIIDSLIFHGGRTVVVSKSHLYYTDVQFEDFDEFKKRIDELKLIWKGVVNIRVQRLDQYGIMYISFSPL